MILVIALRSRTSSGGPLAAVLFLSLCGGSGLLSWARWQETLLPEWSGQNLRRNLLGTGEPVTARTDRGRVVQLWRVERAGEATGTEAVETEAFWKASFGDTLVRTAPSSPESNCHGWVFADGRYWLDGEEIDCILLDNGYQEVTAPHPGDVIVYRPSYGRVAHTGLVRSVADDGAVVVESKWGSKGRFLHAPETQPQWTCWSYYRSPRASHCLAGIEPPAAASVAAACGD